jgi:hypothetical protein
VTCLLKAHVRCSAFHHGVAHPHVVNGEVLQVWMVAVNILNKQLQTAVAPQNRTDTLDK